MTYRSEMPEDERELARQRLSDLMDGRVDADASSVVQAWASDADLRASWHAYHLAADIMRSEDLASPARQDEAFLQRLRLQLALEPVPFAPQALAAAAGPAPPRRAVAGRWMAPFAVAAGFMAVAGFVVVQRTAEVPAAAGVMAGMEWGAMTPVAGSSPQIMAPPLSEAWSHTATLVPAPQGLTGGLIRDARLDRYFETHRRASGFGVGQVPGADLRTVDAVMQEPR